MCTNLEGVKKNFKVWQHSFMTALVWLRKTMDCGRQTVIGGPTKHLSLSGTVLDKQTLKMNDILKRNR